MARWENEKLDGLNLPDIKSVKEEFYSANATIVENEKEAVAKVANIEDKKVYYIKHGRGEIFDPWGIDRNRQHSFIFSLRKVNEEIFNLYIEYLKTRREVFLTRARRLFINLGA
jgi:hypothetical protein